MQHRAGRHLCLSPLIMGDRRELAVALSTSDSLLALFDEAAIALALTSTAPRAVTSGAALVRLSASIPSLSRATRAVVRYALRRFDALFVYSDNQVGLISDFVRPAPWLCVKAVPFGIDISSWRSFERGGRSNEDRSVRVLAAGRDQGRDYATFLAAISRPVAGVEVRLMCRPFNLVGLRVPGHIHQLGFLPRPDYRAEIEAADIVVVPTHEMEYATGQTVVAEAMASGAAVVVTRTRAMESFLGANPPVVYVPPADPSQLRTAITEFAQQKELRGTLASAARSTALSQLDQTNTYRAMLEEL